MKNVLVVDDNPLNRDLASAMLARSGFRPVIATSASEALALLDVEPIDVVVTDIGMPQMSGIELCQAIVARFGAVRPRVVAFTSFGMPAERARIMDAGFDALVVKPSSRAALVAAITPESTGAPSCA